MSQFNVFQALYMSFFSKKLYRDVGQNWGGKAVTYLLLLAFLCSVVIAIQCQLGLNKAYQESSSAFVSQIPVMVYSNKEGIKTPQNKPYIIKVPDSEQVFAIIDTSGKYKTLDEAKAELLITKDTVIIHKDKQETRVYHLTSDKSDGEAYTIDPEAVNHFIGKVLWFLWIPVLLALLVFYFVFGLLQTLFYGILGKLINLATRAKLTYWQVVQLAMVAITPSAVLCFFISAWWLTFLVSMVFLTFALIANR